MLHVREPGHAHVSELDAEVDRAFASLTAYAEATQSHVKLKPLAHAQRPGTVKVAALPGP